MVILTHLHLMRCKIYTSKNACPRFCAALLLIWYGYGVQHAFEVSPSLSLYGMCYSHFFHRDRVFGLVEKWDWKCQRCFEIPDT